MQEIQFPWGDAEKKQVMDEFWRIRRSAPLGISQLTTGISMSGSTMVTREYAAPRRGKLSTEVGTRQTEQELTFWRPVLRTVGMEYGIRLSLQGMSDTGNMITPEKLIPDLVDGCSRTLDDYTLTMMEGPIMGDNDERQDFPKKCMVPFDTRLAGNQAFAAADPTRPTWQELTMPSTLVEFGSAGAYASPQKLRMMLARMRASGISAESPKICIMSPFQSNMFCNHPEMKNLNFSIVPALAVTSVEDLPMWNGIRFIEYDQLPRGVPRGPNPYNGGQCLEGYSPAGMPSELEGQWIEHCLLYSMDDVTVATSMPWRLDSAPDVTRRFDQIIFMQGKYGASRTHRAAVCSIECVTSEPYEVEFSVQKGA
jgi:hypothetical protein